MDSTFTYLGYMYYYMGQRRYVTNIKQKKKVEKITSKRKGSKKIHRRKLNWANIDFLSKYI